MFSRPRIGSVSSRATSTCALFVLLASCQGSSFEPDELQRSALAINPSVVISQVYGGGSNSQAPYTHDFVELFNRSQSPVSIDGWSVQYTSASGTGNFAPVALSGSLQPGQYYLVQLSGGTVGSPLPTPDATGSLALAASAGKVILVNASAALTCNTAATCSAAQLASIVDLVGYGSANFYEGSAATPALSNTTAAVRALGGCTDNNQNGTDFTAAAPSPRTKASALAPCSTANVPPQVSLVSPANAALNVPLESNVGITFSESVTTSGAWATLACTISGAVSATISGGPSAFTLDPSVALANSETCTVTVLAANVSDADGAALAESFVSTFTTISAGGLTAIHTIQGASQLSPLTGSAVTTRGIVTALDSNGYYLQDPTPDSNDATSEAVFVFTSSAPTVKVGDDVQLSATVSEFRSGCSNCAPTSSAYANLTTTELVSPTGQTVLSQNNALPAPVVLGSGGRAIPTTIIKAGSNGDVEIVPNPFSPATDGLDFYESLEGMRVQLNDAVAVGPTASFTGGSLELPVLADNGVGAGLRTSRGGIVISATDFNPERIALANDLLPALPAANVGDKLPGAIVGVMSYTFANPKLFTTQALPALVKSGVTQEVISLSARRPVDLDIAAFNVENLDPTDPASKFSQLASILVDNLKSPDIVALEEIQDNDGAANNGVVSASATLDQLAAAVKTAGGPTYSHRSIDPVNGQDGGEPGGNIRVAFLYRTDRGLSFVDKAGASATTANSVVSGANGPELQYSPGRIDPSNGAFASSRKPLAGQFSFQGKTLFVIANHFNSKGGDHPLFGRFQPPVLSSELQRVNQATVVKTFVAQLLAADAKAQVVVLGDLNDFEFSAPLALLKGAGLSTLVERLPASERYTYVYQGNSQVLDHVLVSPAANTRVVGYDVVHVNAEFATQASDHDPGVARLSFDSTAPILSGPSPSPSAVATSATGTTVSFTVTASDAEDGTLPVTCVPASASLFAVGTTPVKCTATDSVGNAGTLEFSVVVQLASGTGGSGGGGGSGGSSGGGGAATGGAATGGSSGSAMGGSATAGSAGDAGESSGGEAMGGGGSGEAGSGGAVAGSAGKAGSGVGDAGEPSTSPGKPSTGDDGCSCSTIPTTSNHNPVLIGFGVVLLGLARRRRTPR